MGRLDLPDPPRDEDRDHDQRGGPVVLPAGVLPHLEARGMRKAGIQKLRVANDQLSNRETEVLQAIANGKTNKEIGAELFLAEETIKSHVRHILAKMCCKNRAHAVSVAHRRRMIL